jgi:cytochrome P450
MTIKGSQNEPPAAVVHSRGSPSNTIYRPDLLSDQDDFFRVLRETDPVHWVETDAVWLVTRHEDVSWLSRHPELFSSQNARRDRRPTAPPIDPADRENERKVNETRVLEFIQSDPPEHLRMRRVFSSHFTARKMEEWRAPIAEVIGQQFDRADAGGRMDIFADLAAPLPLLVISELFGVPEADRVMVKEQADRRMASALSTDPGRMREAVVAMEESAAYFDEQIELRMREPRNDMLNLFAEGERAGAYTRPESVANAQNVIDAGHETTVQLICNGLHSLLRRRDAWEQLVSDPEGLAESASEELLRWDPSVAFLRRIATQDLELHGRQIREGDRVYGVIPAANRDPRVFEDPERFDIARSPNPHLSFNVGLHACLGKFLAKVEMQEVLKALALRFPGARVVEDEVEWLPERRRRTVKALPVVWS